MPWSRPQNEPAGAQFPFALVLLGPSIVHLRWTTNPGVSTRIVQSVLPAVT